MANELPVTGLDLGGKLFKVNDDGKLEFDGSVVCLEGGDCGGDSLAHGSEDDPYVVSTAQEFIDVMAELNNSSGKIDNNVHVHIEAGDYSFDDTIILSNAGRNENARILIKMLDKDNTTFSFTGENKVFLQIMNSFIKFVDFEVSGNDKAAFIAAIGTDIEFEQNTCKISSFKAGLAAYYNSIIRGSQLTIEDTLYSVFLYAHSYAMMDGSTITGWTDTTESSKYCIFIDHNSSMRADGLNLTNTIVGIQLGNNGVLLADQMTVNSNLNCVIVEAGSRFNSAMSHFNGDGDNHEELVIVKDGASAKINASYFKSSGAYAIKAEAGAVVNAEHGNFTDAENIAKATEGAVIKLDSANSDNENGKNVYLEYGSKIFAFDTEITANIDANTATLSGVFYK
jgi:hypothetical protein